MLCQAEAKPGFLPIPVCAIGVSVRDEPEPQITLTELPKADEATVPSRRPETTNMVDGPDDPPLSAAMTLPRHLAAQALLGRASRPLLQLHGQCKIR